MATRRCCPSTATSPGRKQRRPAWCARPRTTGTASRARARCPPPRPGPRGFRPPAHPGARSPPSARPWPARPGGPPGGGGARAAAAPPGRPRPPRRHLPRGPRLLGLSRKQCHAYSARRPGSLPGAALRPRLVLDFSAREESCQGRWPVPPGSGETEVRRGSSVGPLALTSAPRGPVGCISAKSRALLLGRVPPGPRDLQAGGPAPGPRALTRCPPLPSSFLTQVKLQQSLPGSLSFGSEALFLRGREGLQAGVLQAGLGPGLRKPESPGARVWVGEGTLSEGPRGDSTLWLPWGPQHTWWYPAAHVGSGPCRQAGSCTSRGLGGLLAEGAAHSCGLLVLGK